MSSLINKKNTREIALAYAEETRPGRFKAVSADFIDRLEAKFRNVIKDEVKRHPSLGKTLK